MMNNKNINNEFFEAELDKEETVANYATTQMKVASVFFAQSTQSKAAKGLMI